MAQTTKNATKTAANKTASLMYRTMQKPHATSYAGEADELTIQHGAGLVAIINTTTKKKNIAVSVGTETHGLRKDGTPWIKHRNVILSVDTLPTMIASLQAALDTVKKHGITAAGVYTLNAADLAFIGAGAKAEPAASNKPASSKKADKEPESQTAIVAGWLTENAAAYEAAADFIDHILENEAAYGGKGVLRQAYNLLAEKYGKDKLQGQPAAATVADAIAAVFFRPKAQAKPEVQKQAPQAAQKPAAVKPAANKVVHAADIEDLDDDALTQLPDFDCMDNIIL